MKRTSSFTAPTEYFFAEYFFGPTLQIVESPADDALLLDLGSGFGNSGDLLRRRCSGDRRFRYAARPNDRPAGFVEREGPVAETSRDYAICRCLALHRFMPKAHSQRDQMTHLHSRLYLASASSVQLRRSMWIGAGIWRLSCDGISWNRGTNGIRPLAKYW